MQPDLSHIQRQITGHEATIAEVRREEQVQRQYADQKRSEGNNSAAEYYEQQAGKLEAHAAELEGELDQLRIDKQRVEQRISQLEAQKAALSRDHEAELIRISDELNRPRGSSLML
ncbi:MAG TPA: hypothetical protein VN081_00390 [Dongiaceae bacterium]|nr:hypothetical protein [Dongiaceae bacterium]